MRCVLVDEAQFLDPMHIEEFREITQAWNGMLHVCLKFVSLHLCSLILKLILVGLFLSSFLLLVPVICYGLRTDFRTNLFPGSQRLLELADTIEEVKTTCYSCNKKVSICSSHVILIITIKTNQNKQAIFNLKHVDGRADVSGPAVQLGCEEKYYPTCAEW